jgi:hypothetical protein
MKFTLEVDLDAVAGEPVDELGRILRYWAGNMKYYDLANPVPPVEVSDSVYTIVGNWSLHD